MAGYNGYSMSNNAVAAYSNGEMPISKWSKAAILEAIFENCEITNEMSELLPKMTLKELQSYFLCRSSWHHTSKFYNCTDFYSINLNAIEKISVEKIRNIILNRQKKSRESVAEIEKEKSIKAQRKNEKEVKEAKEKLFKYQTKYKTLSGYMHSNSINFEELEKIRLEKISEKREQLRKNWEMQGYAYGLERIEDDSFVESYMR